MADGPDAGASTRQDPAAADEFRRGEVRCVSRHGFHRVAYTDWGDEAAPRGVVVCVHGLPRQGRDFDRVAAGLARRGFRVVCPDLVGRGRSEWLPQHDEYELPQFVLDMTVLLARLGAETVDWIGTSLGGLVGMILAGQAGSPIRRMIVNDIGPVLPWAALRRIGEGLEQQPREFADLAAAERHFRELLASFGALSDADWRQLTVHSVAEARAGGPCTLLHDPGIVRAFRPLRAYNLNLWNYWDRISAPTLLLRGATSDLLPRELAREMTRRGPRPRLVEVEGCGHAPALLDARQVDLVADWLMDGPAS